MTTPIPSLPTPPTSGPPAPTPRGRIDSDQLREIPFTILREYYPQFCSERSDYERIAQYRDGKAGIPEVPDDATREVRDLARLSVKNVLPLVTDTFCQAMDVVGFRPARRPDNLPVWSVWENNRMASRQAQVHRAALDYGISYLLVTPSNDPNRKVDLIPRSPRQTFAVYSDPRLDQFPVAAFDTWFGTSDEGKPVQFFQVWDAWSSWLLQTPAPNTRPRTSRSGGVGADDQVSLSSSDFLRVLNSSEVEFLGDHGVTFNGNPVCPVVRFTTSDSAEDVVRGEIEPLIPDQVALNEVSFDRLILARFGAFPQDVITGWAPAEGETLPGSARRTLAFEDEGTQVTRLQQATLTPYNELMQEYLEQIAMRAQLSPAQITGKMTNLSADALASADAQAQRKIQSLRSSFGSSWRTALLLAAEIAEMPITESDAPEEVWRDTEARSFAAVVDGVKKLSEGTQPVPMAELVDLIPGLSTLQRESIRRELRAQAAQARMDSLAAAAAVTSAQARQAVGASSSPSSADGDAPNVTAEFAPNASSAVPRQSDAPSADDLGVN